MSHLLTSRRGDLWPILQPATRGQSRRFGFIFWERLCRPSFYTVYVTDQQTDISIPKVALLAWLQNNLAVLELSIISHDLPQRVQLTGWYGNVRLFHLYCFPITLTTFCGIPRVAAGLWLQPVNGSSLSSSLHSDMQRLFASPVGEAAQLPSAHLSQIHTAGPPLLRPGSPYRQIDWWLELHDWGFSEQSITLLCCRDPALTCARRHTRRNFYTQFIRGVTVTIGLQFFPPVPFAGIKQRRMRGSRVVRWP